MALRVVIIGAVAAGPKAGCRIKRLKSDAQVTLIDKDDYISYGGCGIPFYVSGDVAELNELLSTSFHFVRNAEFFRGAKGVNALPGVEALEIDRAAKQVLVRKVSTGEEERLAYDKLILATGSTPVVPPIPGVKSKGVLPVANLHQAEAIKDMVAKGRVETAAIVGAGSIGLEMAESLADLWGVEVNVFELTGQVLPGVLDSEMARMVQVHLEAQEGVKIRLSSPVEEIVADEGGRVTAVKSLGREFPADLVILATGVRPNAELAQKAGLDLDEFGAVLVNENLQTSDPDIYAGGDCISLPNPVSGKRQYVPAGSLANRAGRVIGTNVCGGKAVLPGTVGSWCMKVFGLSVARCGITQDQAEALGFEVVAPLVVQADRAHFHPDHAMMYLKLVVDKKSRKVLGISALGENGDAVKGRVDALAGLLFKGALLEDISELELAYSPPLGAAVDILNAAANTCENMLEGRLVSMRPEEFSRRLAECRGSDGDAGCVFLDMRAIGNAEPYLKSLAPYWKHLPQETLAQRLDEVPKDKEVILVCNSGARSYEAQCFLSQAGFDNTHNLSGGVVAAMKWGEPILPPEPKED